MKGYSFGVLSWGEGALATTQPYCWAGGSETRPYPGSFSIVFPSVFASPSWKDEAIPGCIL